MGLAPNRSSRRVKRAFLRSCWTAVNELGQIRMQVLAPTKHNAHCTASLIKLQESLAFHGHSPVTLLTVDNPKADAAWAQSVVPSLQQHVTPIGAPNESGLPLASVPVEVLVTKSVTDMEQWCHCRLLAWERSGKKEMHCGLDTEHTPGFGQQARGKTALIQLAFEDQVIILQVCYCVYGRARCSAMLTSCSGRETLRTAPFSRQDSDRRQHL